MFADAASQALTCAAHKPVLTLVLHINDALILILTHMLLASFIACSLLLVSVCDCAVLCRLSSTMTLQGQCAE